MDASELSPDVITLVERLRTPTESIWMCSGVPTESVSVFMIEEENISTALAMQSIGLSGGGGRVFTFGYHNGEWTLSGRSEYIC